MTKQHALLLIKNKSCKHIHNCSFFKQGLKLQSFCLPDYYLFLRHQWNKKRFDRAKSDSSNIDLPPLSDSKCADILKQILFNRLLEGQDLTTKLTEKEEKYASDIIEEIEIDD